MKLTDVSGHGPPVAMPPIAVRTLNPNFIDGRQKNDAGVVQDGLTLNLGMRCEMSPPSDIRNKMRSRRFLGNRFQARGAESDHFPVSAFFVSNDGLNGRG